MERMIYRKGELQRVAYTSAECVRLEHDGWQRNPAPVALDLAAVPSEPGAAPDTAVPDAAEATGIAPEETAPEQAGPTPARRRGKTSS